MFYVILTGSVGVIVRKVSEVKTEYEMVRVLKEGE